MGSPSLPLLQFIPPGQSKGIVGSYSPSPKNSWELLGAQRLVGSPAPALICGFYCPGLSFSASEGDNSTHLAGVSGMLGRIKGNSEEGRASREETCGKCSKGRCVPVLGQVSPHWTLSL